MSRKHTPSRVTIARMRRGLQRWQLADACRIARERMASIENGDCAARMSEIRRIAEATRFPEGFFFRPHIEMPTLASTSIRG